MVLDFTVECGFKARGAAPHEGVHIRVATKDATFWVRVDHWPLDVAQWRGAAIVRRASVKCFVKRVGMDNDPVFAQAVICFLLESIRVKRGPWFQTNGSMRK